MPSRLSPPPAAGSSTNGRPMITFISSVPFSALRIGSPTVAPFTTNRNYRATLSKPCTRSRVCLPSRSILKPVSVKYENTLYDDSNNSNNNNNNNNGNIRTTFHDGDDDGDDDGNEKPDHCLRASFMFPALMLCANNGNESRDVFRVARSTSRTLRPRKLYVSHVILGLNIVIFVIQSMFMPSLLMAAAKINSAIATGQYYRLLSPMFVHASTTHLLVNSFSLNSTGPSVESWFGKRRFLFLYTFSGLCGNLLSYLCTPSPAVGASGAIFGLVGASAVMLARHNRLLGRRASRGLQSLIYIVITNFALGLTPGSRIDNFGHLGGFAGGILFSYLFGPSLKIRHSGKGRRPILYDEPVVVQVMKDIQKRFDQLRRLLKQN